MQMAAMVALAATVVIPQTKPTTLEQVAAEVEVEAVLAAHVSS
jgi:hypothetical protein